jgi:hypothetical protein
MAVNQLLLDFLTRVSQDPALQQQYTQNPRGYMTANGISTPDQDAVLSGNRERLKLAVGVTNDADCFALIFGASSSGTVSGD